MTERNAVCAGATIGAFVGGAVAYLFFTVRGRTVRDRMEPAVDDLMREFHKFRRTLEKVGGMANDGLRAFNEFQQARSDTPFSTGTRTSH